MPVLFSPYMETLTDFFLKKHYKQIEPPVLQPTRIFTELSGEDLRRRLFVTQDQDGNDLCLRPEYTIPVAREHLTLKTDIPAHYYYMGPVFRFRSDASGEFLQAGTELIGRKDEAAADAECIVLALQALERIGQSVSSVMIGDMALLTSVLEALKLSESGKRHVITSIISGKSLDSSDSSELSVQKKHAALLAAIEKHDPDAVKAFVEDIFAIAGISRIGGRSTSRIAERFLAKTANQAALSGEQKAILETYLAITGEPDDSIEKIQHFAKATGLDISKALSDFETRTGFMAALKADLSCFRFNAGFVRNLDYYTGFIFEIHTPFHDKPDAGTVTDAQGLRFCPVLQEDRLCEGFDAVDNVALVLPGAKRGKVAQIGRASCRERV